MFLREGFNMMGGAKMAPVNSVLFFVLLIAVQLALIWFAKLLWNMYLTKCVTIVKPIKDIWQMLAVFVLLKVLF
jgi:hypothetical protein